MDNKKIMTFDKWIAETYYHGNEELAQEDYENIDYLTLGQEYGEYVQMCLLTPETPLI